MGQKLIQKLSPAQKLSLIEKSALTKKDVAALTDRGRYALDRELKSFETNGVLHRTSSYFNTQEIITAFHLEPLIDIWRKSVYGPDYGRHVIAGLGEDKVDTSKIIEEARREYEEELLRNPQRLAEMMQQALMQQQGIPPQMAHPA